MSRTIRSYNVTLDVFFVLFLVLTAIKARNNEKYFIEIPHSFYLNLTNQSQKPLELWHPRLVLSQITEIEQEITPQVKKPGMLKERVWRGSRGISFLEISNQIEPNIKSNKMACACKFIPDYSGSETSNEQKSNFIEKQDETMLIQTNANSQPRKQSSDSGTHREISNEEEKYEVKKKDKDTYIEDIEEEKPKKNEIYIEKKIKNEEKETDRKEENKEKENSKEIDKKELLEMYEKLEKLLKLEESKEGKNQKNSDANEEQNSDSEKGISPQKKEIIVRQNPVISQDNENQIIVQQKPQIKKQVFVPQPQYILQPINSNFLQAYQRRIPQPFFYDYGDSGYYDQSSLQGNNVRYITVQQQQQQIQPKVIVVPQEQQSQQQVVYVDSNGQILGY